jgi:hypothetical protein
MTTFTVLDSGASQHVLLPDDDPQHVWKIPAVCNALLPTPISVVRFNPTVAWKAAGWRTFRRVAPALLLDRAEGSLIRYAALRRRQRFVRMLRVLQYLLRTTRGEPLLLPCHIVTAVSLQARWTGGVLVYRGAALVQRRADRFIAGRFDSGFDTDAMIRAQHRLWTLGVGLDDGSAVLGPHDWAVLDGRILLGDTGSLTTDRGAVWRTLQPAVLDRACTFLLRRCTDAQRDEATRHVARARAALTHEALQRIWRSRC